MTIVVYNCIVCANEFNSTELQSSAASKINTTRYKICQSCLNKCDPQNDYRVAKEIINSYLKASEAKTLFNEALDIIESIKK